MSDAAPFQGFSERYGDFPDFILTITREIWEGRAIGSLNHLYSADIPMRFPSGVVVGNQATIDGTMATLAEFPDRTLLGEDVIWCGNAEDGYLSSHRLVSTAHCTGVGPYGTLIPGARGKPIRIRAIADCAAKADVIYDEWLIRDSGAIVRQLGGEPERFARALIDLEGGPERAVRPWTPDNDVGGDYTSQGNAGEWGARYASILQSIMGKDFDIVPARYDRACAIEAPGVSGTSWEAADRFWLPLRSSFPRAEFTIHHTIGREDPMLSPRAAVRWSLWGEHGGWGTYGVPTGARVYIAGISHAEFGPWGLRREWTLLDEISVWKQIHLHRIESGMEAA